MSVASKNPFSILGDEDSSRPDTPAASKAPAAPKAPAPAANTTQQKARGGPAARGGKYYARGGKPGPRDSATVNEDVPVPEGKKFEGGRGGRGGRGRGGRGRGGGGGQRFDRHSQTGKTDSDKKVHQGWGGDEASTELKTEQAASADAAADWGADASAPNDWAAPVEGDAAAVPAAEGDAKPEGRPRREREPEEEDNTLTLDQYLAQQKEKDAVVPKIEGVRQANEGAADDLWKDAVPLSKNEEEEAYFAGKAKSAPKARTEKKEKVFLEIDARFERPDRGGRGRGRGGDRGGDRGRGGERRGRGGRPPRQNGGNAANINVDDQNAFPSLS